MHHKRNIVEVDVEVDDIESIMNNNNYEDNYGKDSINEEMKRSKILRRGSTTIDANIGLNLKSSRISRRGSINFEIKDFEGNKILSNLVSKRIVRNGSIIVQNKEPATSENKESIKVENTENIKVQNILQDDNNSLGKNTSKTNLNDTLPAKN